MFHFMYSKTCIIQPPWVKGSGLNMEVASLVNGVDSLGMGKWPR